MGNRNGRGFPPIHVPHLDRAEVNSRKLRDYLLSRDHPLGHPKARFFLGLGFRHDAVDSLRAALIAHARANPVVVHETTAFGSKYVVDGRIEAPNGRDVAIRAVWFVEHGAEQARFVTAYPAKESTP
jgi:hypothetical protein